VLDPDDLRVPSDYVLPEKYKEEYNKKHPLPSLATQRDGKTAAPVPWYSYLPAQPDVTTVTEDELNKALQELRKREVSFCHSLVRYMREQGKTLSFVYQKMAPTEFVRWVTGELQVSPSTVRRMIALYHQLEQLKDKRLEQLLENARGITQQKLQLLLQNEHGIDMMALLMYTTVDKRGREVPLTALPFAEMKAEIKRLAERIQVQNRVEEALDTVLGPTPPKGLPEGEETSSGTEYLGPDGSIREETGEDDGEDRASPLPLNPLPFIIAQRDGLRAVSHTVDEWNAQAKPKVDVGDVAPLSPRQLAVVEGHIMALGALRDAMGQLVDDLRQIVSLAKGDGNGM